VALSVWDWLVLCHWVRDWPYLSGARWPFVTVPGSGPVCLGLVGAVYLLKILLKIKVFWKAPRKLLKSDRIFIPILYAERFSKLYDCIHTNIFKEVRKILNKIMIKSNKMKEKLKFSATLFFTYIYLNISINFISMKRIS
jgi:hypothetical protein